MRFWSALPLFILLMVPAMTQAEENDTVIAKQIDKSLSHSCLSLSASAVRVTRLQSGELVYDHNGLRSLLPASVTKLVTTAVALHSLGPGYRFATELSYLGHRQGKMDEKIPGDLFIKGGGDPKLTPEIVWRIVEEILRRGITTIEGDLVVDGSFFDDADKAPGWRKNRSSRAYDAKLGAISVSFNSVAVHLMPGHAVGDPIRVATDPVSDIVTVDNRGRTIGKGRSSIAISGTVQGEKFRIRVKGAMAVGADKKVRYINVPDPALFAGEVFRTYLRRAGVTVAGSVRKGITPEKTTPLLTHHSLPLVDLLRLLNRYSSNFMAEQIFKTMAAVESGQPGSHKHGFELTKEILGEFNVNTSGANFADASGLSRKERATARLFTDLFTAMHRRFDLWPDFLSSLAIMGVEGSMKDRLKHSAARGYVRAKTGSLFGVSNLVGVMAASNGQLYSFAIFLNDNRCGAIVADQIEDNIINAIYKTAP